MVKGALGNVIRKSRISLGYSQEELSEKIGITPTHMKHLESEHRKPSLEVLIRLMETLGFSFDALVFPSSDNTIQNEWLALLSDCTESEQNIIRDMVISIKKNHLT